LPLTIPVNNKSILDPNWITGFVDGEGCFTCIVSKRKIGNWRIILSFEINLHIKDINILYQIKDYFGCVNINSRSKPSLCVYRVTSISDLINVIIPHFEQFQLNTQKQLDFKLWKYISQEMTQKNI
jgi:hypothetical protein